MGKQSRRKARFRRAWRESGRAREPYAARRHARQRRAARRRRGLLAVSVLGWFAVMAFLAGAPPPLLIGTALVALCCAPAAYGLWLLATQLRARRWPATPCEVLAQDLREERGEGRWRSRQWVPVVHYAYEVEGVAYTSDALHLVPQGFHLRGDAIDRMAAYEPGSKRSCFYDPREPARAVLERDLRLGVPALLVAASLTAIVPLAVALARGGP